MSNTQTTTNPPPTIRTLREMVGVVIHDRMPVEEQLWRTLEFIDDVSGTTWKADLHNALRGIDQIDMLQVLVDETDRAIDQFNDFLPDPFYAAQEDGEFWILVADDEDESFTVDAWGLVTFLQELARWVQLRPDGCATMGASHARQHGTALLFHTWESGEFVGANLACGQLAVMRMAERTRP